MLKIVFIILGVIVLIVIAFIIWWSHHPIVMMLPVSMKVTGVAIQDEPAKILQCTLRMTGSTSPPTINEIAIPRELVDSMGALPPSGFTEEPLIEGPKVGDKEFVDEYNKNNVRWVGQTLLPADQDVVFSIPVKQYKASAGTISFRYERAKSVPGTFI